MKRDRNSDQKKSKLIAAVGEILAEKGYAGLGANKIALRAGVSKPMIYEYFGGLNGLLKAYIAGKDTWIPYFESLQLPERPTTEELKTCFIKMLHDQFIYFHDNREMQKLVLWQISEINPLMHTICQNREREGVRLIELTDKHFHGSGVSLKAVMALLVGGIYFNVLHDSAETGTMAGIDLSSEKDFKRMLKTIEQVVNWAFDTAEKSRLAATTIVSQVINTH